MTSPEFEPLPDTQSDQEPTPYESSLIHGGLRRDCEEFVV